MGRFSTTVQIKNYIDRMKFVNSFCDVMKKRGFVPCSEDEAALSYLLAFDEGGWVTLANENYRNDPQKAYDDSRQMAAALKTSAFSVEVVDSDFAIIKLLDPNGGEDEAVVGDGSGYGIKEAPRGERKYWENLLADGKTWEQFSETAAKHKVFVEDTLSEIATILGITPYYIDADFNEVLGKADENKNITAFYFKKADAKAKSMSLNAAFKQVFGEALEPLGFKLIKSKYPYFVRVVPGGEIIHVISFYKDQSFDPQCNSINIVGGVATVYRPKIDLLRNPKGENWLIDNEWIYSLQRPINSDNIGERFYRFVCSTDEQKMLKDLNAAFEITSQIMLRMLDKVVNIDACIEFSQEIGMSLYLYDENFENEDPRRYYNEGFLYFKTDKNIFRKNMMHAVSDIALREKSFFEKVQSQPQLYNMVQSELERRKVLNFGILRSYGLDL